MSARPVERAPARGPRIEPGAVRVQRWRVLAVAAAVGLGLCGVGIKAARLQLGFGDDLRGLAEDQYLRSIKLAEPRGQITDRAGQTLAVSVPAWSIAADPTLLDDKDGAARVLAAALAVPERQLREKLDTKGRFVWLHRRTRDDVADAVRALGIPGVTLKREMRRVYPNKGLAGQLLGSVDVDGNARGGVEQALDAELSGQATVLPSLADNHGDRIALMDGVDLSLLEGDDVALTLDARLQHEAEEALAAAITENDAKSAWALVLDAKTGAILAVANAPTFNPNTREHPSTARNRAFAEAFEPGSIFKVATFAAALDAGVLRPNDHFFCENGRYALGKHVIHDTHPEGDLTAVQVFARSSNIGTLKIAARLGEERLKGSIQAYGFGHTLGTGLLEETAGRVPAQSRWGDVRTATISFGHGILVNALQVASLVQAVANGGVRQTPYLVERITNSAGDVVRQGSSPGSERLMSEKTAAALALIMRSVVEPDGTGAAAAIPGIAVAGKTGTAEKVDPLTHRYSRDLHVASFVGFAPAEAPSVVAIVVVDEPKGEHFGGTAAAPAWRRIVERALVDRGELATLALVQKAALAPLAQRADTGADLADDGARTTAASAAASAEVVPTFAGMSLRQAQAVAERAGLHVSPTGSGQVISQKPPAGAARPLKGTVQLMLASPASLRLGMRDGVLAFAEGRSATGASQRQPTKRASVRPGGKP